MSARSPIERIIDSTARCVVCGSVGIGTCGCWVRCACGRIKRDNEKGCPHKIRPRPEREGEQVKKIAPKILAEGERARVWASAQEIEMVCCPYCARRTKATHVVVVETWVSYLAGQSRVEMCKAHAEECARAIMDEIVTKRARLSAASATKKGASK